MLKKIAALAAVVVISVSLGAAACEGKQRPSKEERLGRMQEHLNLSDDQVSQIRGIHENGGGREEVAAVLTEDQQQKMRDFHKNKRNKHRQSQPESQE